MECEINSQQVMLYLVNRRRPEKGQKEWSQDLGQVLHYKFNYRHPSYAIQAEENYRISIMKSSGQKQKW